VSSGIRASDHDRDRTANLLREHHAVGRLDPEEFADRLDKSFHAKTVEELDRLTADLPAIDLYPLPTASLPKNRVVRTGLPAASVFRQAGSGRFSPGWLAAWGSWGILLVISFVLWAALGVGGWPLLGMAVIGVIMGGRWIIGPRAVGHGRSGRRQLGNLRPDEIDSGSDKP
jgi:Domain of unknown function (DUF1707)